MKTKKIIITLLCSMLFTSLSYAHEEACKLPPKTTQFTFWETCKNVKMNGCMLEAECRIKGPEVVYRATNFDMNKFPQCYSDIFGGRNMENLNGRLCCGYAGTYSICGK